MKKFLLRALVAYLVVAMFMIGITPQVDAGFSPSQMIGAGAAARDIDVQHVRSFLEMKVAADRFAQLGFTPGEVESRLSALNDEQLHQIALKVDQVKVGGDGVGVVIAVLVIVVLVLLILRLARMM
jgi:hypothetical protein